MALQCWAVIGCALFQFCPSLEYLGFIIIGSFLLFPSDINSASQSKAVVSTSEDTKKAVNLSPYYWEIKIRIDSSGDYGIKEGEKSNEGRYSFVLLWTGCMEKDQDDYLIYHENSELLEWKAKEKVKQSEVSRELTEYDFSEKPNIQFNYIIRKGEDLHFDFLSKASLSPTQDQSKVFTFICPLPEKM